MLRINKPTLDSVKSKNIGKYITLENGNVSYKIVDISFNNNYIIEFPYNEGIAKRELHIQVYDFVTISNKKLN